MFWKRKASQPLGIKEPEEDAAEAREPVLKTTRAAAAIVETVGATAKAEAGKPRAKGDPIPLEYTADVLAEDGLKMEELFVKPNQTEGGRSAKLKEIPQVKEADLRKVFTKPDAKKEATIDLGKSDSMDSLFENREKEENPLAALILSLPNISAGELLTDAQEVRTLVGKWQSVATRVT